MKIKSFVLSVLAGGLFFLFAVATSQPDEDFFSDVVTLSADVAVVDTFLTLKNTDTLIFSNANLTLTEMQVDSMGNTLSHASYFIAEYTLSPGNTDTIPLSAFKNDLTGQGDSYPIDVFPVTFNIEFFQDNKFFNLHVEL